MNEVLEGKGDLLKFAGDAVFIEWKATEETDLEHCVEAAVNCAAKILLRCSDFSVLANGANNDNQHGRTARGTKIFPSPAVHAAGDGHRHEHSQQSTQAHRCVASSGTRGIGHSDDTGSHCPPGWDDMGGIAADTVSREKSHV